MAAPPVTLQLFEEIDLDARVAVVDQVAALFEEYRQLLGSLHVPIDSFQSFSAEVTSLPGKYSPSENGCLVVGLSGIRVFGCIALRPVDIAGIDPGRACEIKRLIVSPDARRGGLGRQLVRRIQVEAARLGYTYAVLDTLYRLPGAEALYQAEGFAVIPAYNDNPMPDVVFMGKHLS